MRKQYETHHVIVRWATYAPFSSQSNENQYKTNIDDMVSRIELNMFSNNLINYCEGTNCPLGINYTPENKLVYKSPATSMQDKTSAQNANGRIIFDIKRGNQVSFKTQRFDDYADMSTLQQQQQQQQQHQTHLQLPQDMNESRSSR